MANAETSKQSKAALLLLEEKVSVLEVEQHALKRSLVASEAAAEAAREEVMALVSERDAVKAQAERQVAAAEADLASLTERLQKQEALIGQLKAYSLAVEKDMVELSASKEKMVGEGAEAKAAAKAEGVAAEAARLTSASLRASLEEVTADLATLQRQVAQKNSLLSALRRTILGAEAPKGESSKGEKAAGEELVAAAQALVASASEHAVVLTRLKAFKQEATAAAARQEDLEHRLQDKASSYATLELDCQRLVQEVQSRQLEVAARDSVVRKLEQKAETFAEEMRKMGEEKRQLAEQLEDKREEAKDLKRQVGLLEDRTGGLERGLQGSTLAAAEAQRAAAEHLVRSKAAQQVGNTAGAPYAL
jgi:chromosome segregation ATPase